LNPQGSSNGGSNQEDHQGAGKAPPHEHWAVCALTPEEQNHAPLTQALSRAGEAAMSGWWLAAILGIAPAIAIVFYIMNRYDTHDIGDKL
jgi:hypothetical protein